MKKHPSGRPIRANPRKELGWLRPFRTEFINDRLNQPAKTFSAQAFGFISPVEQIIYEDDTYAEAKK